MPSLTLQEAQRRASLITVSAYDVRLDLDQGTETFGSTTTVTFTCREPGAETFIDVSPVQIESVLLNGEPVEAALENNRVVLADLAAENEVVVRATMRYSRDGSGLHRAVDPADDKVYLQALSAPADAPRWFACFDQPDLKAPFDIEVAVPQAWVAYGNGAAERVDETHWRLATTPPLAPYYVTLVAGEYVSVTDEHDGIPLALHTRASLERQLREQAPEMLEITKECLDYYRDAYEIEYPYGQYHQAFVPELPPGVGAMENPGCVTFRDQYVFVGSISEAQRLERANVIAHEMAHMWFGDMVTMRWWDDLWLNESFAEYMAYRALSEATRFTDAWVNFGAARKSTGYTNDRSPATHPIAGMPAPDVSSALQNCDMISYAKGASALRQLAAYLGDDAFLAGVRTYLRDHVWGNATLSDFLRAMASASGRDLSTWSRAWLQTAGTDTLRLDVAAQDGALTEVTLRRTPPSDFPAERPHVLDLTGFTDGEVVLSEQVELKQPEQRISSFAGATAPAVLIPNAADLTFAAVVYDEATTAALPEQLPLIPDALARSAVWAALDNGVARAQVDPRTALEIAVSSLPSEQNASILELVARRAGELYCDLYLPEAERAHWSDRLADVGHGLLATADPAGTTALTAARLVARSSSDTALLRRWLADEDRPEQLRGDTEFGWAVAVRLARLDELDAAEIDRLAEQDNTVSGHLSALSAKAVRPTAEAKEWAWDQVFGESDLSAEERDAVAGTFWVTPEPALVQPYVERYFGAMKDLSRTITGFSLMSLAYVAYPLAVVEPLTLKRTRAAVANTDLPAVLGKVYTDMSGRLTEVLASREAFPALSGVPA
ncbi:aminopeptidase N [Luteipulveratus sp. YIM 133132]|uniref:Aminopeptidase N n=1 Tax=Luteipulveratus flavus TaxID=3031728 RepID=A0ABT6C6X0_9MICO|nr:MULTISPECIES: aminopeptidase N [unclassified Luteipulveratus]MDE9365144.1 aminopeptidase N [Luteipulveratus sp. YIM 133132]MDF8264520.1 aminopeptidase N [Luteipulveratus sp. YIM 133296]